MEFQHPMEMRRGAPPPRTPVAPTSSSSSARDTSRAPTATATSAAALTKSRHAVGDAPSRIGSVAAATPSPAASLSILLESLPRIETDREWTGAARRIGIGDDPSGDRVERRRCAHDEPVTRAQHERLVEHHARGERLVGAHVASDDPRPDLRRPDVEAKPRTRPDRDLGARHECHVGANQRRRPPISVGDDGRSARHVRRLRPQRARRPRASPASPDRVAHRAPESRARAPFDLRGARARSRHAPSVPDHTVPVTTVPVPRS